MMVLAPFFEAFPVFERVPESRVGGSGARVREEEKKGEACGVDWAWVTYKEKSALETRVMVRQSVAYRNLSPSKIQTYVAEIDVWLSLELLASRMLQSTFIRPLL